MRFLQPLVPDFTPTIASFLSPVASTVLSIFPSLKTSTTTVVQECAKRLEEANAKLYNDIGDLYHRLRYRKNVNRKLRQRACIVNNILTEMKTLDSFARGDPASEAAQANASRGGDSAELRAKNVANNICIEKEKRKRKRKPKKHTKKSNKKN